MTMFDYFLYQVNYFSWADYLGTFTFALSGALVAQKRSMDLFGILVVAFCTAVGGGTLRDLCLGLGPVTWVREPIYLMVIAAAAGAALCVRNLSSAAFLKAMLFFDAFGLAVFAVIGAKVAMAQEQHSVSIVIIMGVVTGVAGGMLRDIICNEVPLVLQKEVYASAAAVGAAFYYGLSQYDLPEVITLTLPIVATLGLRILSVCRNWSLPVFQPLNQSSIHLNQ